LTKYKEREFTNIIYEPMDLIDLLPRYNADGEIDLDYFSNISKALLIVNLLSNFLFNNPIISSRYCSGINSNGIEFFL
jgi:hypothetical protein